MTPCMSSLQRLDTVNDSYLAKMLAHKESSGFFDKGYPLDVDLSVDVTSVFSFFSRIIFPAKS